MKHPRSPISVVIPSYAGEKLLQKHLPSVFAQLQADDEVIIVDDASPAPNETEIWIAQETPKWEAQGIGLRCIVHEKNQRFAAAVNTGVAHARHEYVWLLNNDVSPLSTKSISQLLEHFSQNPHLFSVGCCEVDRPEINDNRAGRGTGNFRRGLLVHWYDHDQDEPKTLWTAGGSMFFHKEKFIALGGMDPQFAPAYEEDRDLSYRALKRGWDLIHDPDVIVLHQHETTNRNVFGNRGISVASWKNQFLLVWKNITDLNLLFSHFIWLPYHLVISNIRERGAVGSGFIWALTYLPGVMRNRAVLSRQQVRTDQEVLDIAGSTPPQELT